MAANLTVFYPYKGEFSIKKDEKNVKVGKIEDEGMR